MNELNCSLLTIVLSASDKPSTPPASLALPLRIHVSRARIDRALVKTAANSIEIERVEFGYSGDAAGHRVEQAVFEIYGTRISGAGSVGGSKPSPIDISLGATRKGAPAVTASAGSVESLT